MVDDVDEYEKLIRDNEIENPENASSKVNGK